LNLDSVSSVTALLEKKKTLLAVQSALDTQKAEYNAKEIAFKRRSDHLHKKDTELQEALFIFNTFLRENEAKRRRAEARALEEIQKKHKWEVEIDGRRMSCEKMKRKCEKLKLCARRYGRYPAYLQSVVDEPSGHFHELQSIVSRYQTLSATHDALVSTQAELTRRQEEIQSSYLNLIKNGSLVCMRMENQIADLNTELEEKTENDRVVEQKEVTRAQMTSKNCVELAQIIHATDNLVGRCRRSLPGLKRFTMRKRPSDDGMGSKKRLSQASTSSISNNNDKDQGQTKQETTLEKKKARVHTAPSIFSQSSLSDSLWKLDEIAEYIMDLQEIVHNIGGINLNSLHHSQHNQTNSLS
jgi:hypothetical protein